MASSSRVIRKGYPINDGMFTFKYRFEYGGSSPPSSPPSSTLQKVSVKIVSHGHDSASPPSSPPTTQYTPHTYTFDKHRKIDINLQSPQGTPLVGEMHIVSLNLEDSADNAGVWCNLHYGEHAAHHFEGVMITFQTFLS